MCSVVHAVSTRCFRLYYIFLNDYKFCERVFILYAIIYKADYCCTFSFYNLTEGTINTAHNTGKQCFNSSQQI